MATAGRSGIFGRGQGRLETEVGVGICCRADAWDFTGGNLAKVDTGGGSVGVEDAGDPGGKCQVGRDEFVDV